MEGGGQPQRLGALTYYLVKCFSKTEKKLHVHSIPLEPLMVADPGVINFMLIGFSFIPTF